MGGFPEAIYVHIPFCRQRCAYCDFNTYASFAQAFWRKYVDGLLADIRGVSASLHAEEDALGGLVRSVFVGGGTPTVLPVEWLGEILSCLEQVFPFAPDCEITVEANPGSVDGAYLRQLVNFGVNRISFGVQSFDNRVLASIGRIHNSAQARECITLAREVGFARINLDLMYGLPGQSVACFAQSLRTALELDPGHLSAYALTLESGTPLARRCATGQCQLPDEDECADMEDCLHDLCPAAGYGRYEISNWCREGQPCRHNLVYWDNREYLGLGCGAVSYRNGWRFRRLSEPGAYVSRLAEGASLLESSEHLSAQACLKETIMMQLRTSQGVDLPALAQRFSLDSARLEAFFASCDARLWRREGQRVAFSRRGFEVSNEVFLELWDTWLSDSAPQFP